MENRHRTAVKAWIAARAAGVKIIVVKDRLELEALAGATWRHHY